MRHKTDGRRQAILDAATELFGQVGYDRTSMTQILSKVGGSKSTLYSYFPSKDALFAAAMVDAMKEQADAMIALLDASDPDLITVLTRFGRAYQELMGTSRCTNFLRTAMSDGVHGSLGVLLYTLGPRQGLSRIAAWLEDQMIQGRLRKEDPVIAAFQLKALLDAGIWEPRLFGALQELEDKIALEHAVRAFLKAYAPTRSALTER